MIFEGTQPTLTQVPPITSPRSIIVTRAPSSTARMAQANAPEPLPMIAMCNGCGDLLMACALFVDAGGFAMRPQRVGCQR